MADATCDQCGCTFEARRVDAKRCSDECRKRYSRAFAVANADKYRARKNQYMREYAASRKAEKAAYDSAHYAKNKDRRREQKRAYYIANLPRYRTYYEKHKESQLERNARRREMFPEEARERLHRRRAAMYGVGVVKVSVRDLRRAELRAHYACSYCQVNQGEHWDHRVPLVRGGAHSIGNLTLSCAQCNFQKHAKTVMEWRIWRRRAGLPELTIL